LNKVVVPVIVSILILGISFSVDSAFSVTQDQKITALDAEEDDEFGDSVSISGDTAVVGAPFDAGAGIDIGSAYVFTRNGDIWTQQAKLTASDRTSGDEFGDSVSISGDTVIVGADGDDDGGFIGSGSAYVFVKPEGGWSGSLTETAKLTASDPGRSDTFGDSVSISGDTVIVGAGRDDDACLPTINLNCNSGSAYVFVKPGGGWSGSLTETAKLTASDAASGDLFGPSVSISGDTAIVGANGNGPGGSAYVFVKPEGGWSGSLTETAKLTASDAAAFDGFGDSVSISGDTVIVGAGVDDDVAPNSGSAYVFVRPAGGWSGNLNQDAKLTASDAAEEDRFGKSVSISGGTAIVGASRDDDVAPNSGSAYRFVKPAEGWDSVASPINENTKLTASDPGNGDAFGVSVSISVGTAIVGASGDDQRGGFGWRCLHI